MGLLTIACPSCGFSRQLPEENVPEGPRRVTCPQCKEIFVYDKAAPPGTNGETSQTAFPEAAASDPSLEQSSQNETPSVSPDDSQKAAAAESADPFSAVSPSKPTALTDIGDLFRLSWELYQERFAPLALLYLLTILAFVIPTLAAVGLGFFTTLLAGGITFIITVALGLLVGIVGSLWCYGGFLSAVLDDSLRLEDALRRGKELILPLAWIFLLGGFLVTGGYLLLIIPGVIFTVWFSLAQFIMPGENVRGLAALLKSREYVRGYWLEVALRLFLVWVVSVLVGAVPLFGPILALLFFPYLMIFHCLIYRDLRALKGEISYSHSTKSKLLWPGVALVGWILVPALLILLFGSLCSGKFRRETPVKVEAAIGGSACLPFVRRV
ncbi:MAG: hypothetical protein EG822_13770 [Deltaproteobacteria bacterium]|nr:hypothetical protein [Deltaproteobacteria bacterium]TLN02753.1 MAG: hypothetical protein FDZ73_10360 [bacterium]